MKKLTLRKKLRKTAPGSKKICRGDQVMALTGNNRGLSGAVLSVQGTQVLVQGLNVRKKHIKPSELHPKGGIVDREMPIHISNLRVCVDGKPVKLKTRLTEGGGRELYYMNGENAISYRVLKNKSNA